ncbi:MULTISPECIES: hypothetical protein [Variovorax]|uniref:Prevent-host-death protein n=1 Tax=Variovorax paradoxus (strain EPS) TaxID=595537 RepID=E6UYJ4_VARPE|nr:MULTISPECIES: hypothetical protein [Variovorax]ADU38897.1 hypothetical protein Varpa_4735 [Variovorax paradoxus EPS]
MMKTYAIPSVQSEFKLREKAEQVVGEEKSLSHSVEAAVRNCVLLRKGEAEFVARGMKSLASARRSGEYVNASEVMRRLKAKLESAKRN